MTLCALAHVDSPFDFSFPTPIKMPNPLLTLTEASIGYGDNIILSNVNLTINAGARIGLLGSNGAGKSSLIKVLAGTLSPLTGKLLNAEALNVGYFAQHQLEQLRLDESPLWHLQRQAPQATEKELRNFLGGFDFQGDKVKEPVRPFSGGEKARLVLALLVHQNPNLLLLDEPTNHLDLDMRHALNVALQDFQGALVVVSHDRHLLRTVTDQFLLVGNSQVQPFAGDLEEYRDWMLAQRNQADAMDGVLTSDSTSTTATSRKVQRQQEALRRQKLKPLLDAVKQAEQQLEHYHARQQALEQQLAEPEIYSDAAKTRLQALLAEKNTIDKALQLAEETWLQAEQTLAEAQV